MAYRHASYSDILDFPAGEGHPIYWNHNPLALRDSLDDQRSDDESMDMDSDLPANHRYHSAPSPAKSCFMAMKGEVGDSLQSLPLNLLADRTESGSRGAATGPHRSQL